MNENNGPMPGILEPDNDESKATSASDSVFDSKEFIGNIKDDKIAAPKKEITIPPILKKWQLWAAVCLLVIASSIVVIIVSIFSKNAQAIAEYDEVISKINAQKSIYDNQFEEFAKEFFDVSDSSALKDYLLYPTKDEIADAKNSCLSRFGASSEDLDNIEKYPSGQDLARDGIDVKKATEQASRVVEAYNSADTSLEGCREDLFTILSHYLEVTVGDFTTNEVGQMLFFSQPITVKNVSKRKMLYINLQYKSYDSTGVELSFRPNISIPGLEDGESAERGMYKYTADTSFSVRKGSDSAKTRFTPKLVKVHVLMEKIGNNQA